MDMRGAVGGAIILAAATLAPPALAPTAPAIAEEVVAEASSDVWFPQSIERREPPFFDGGAFTRLDYVPLERAAESWDLCAVLPPQDFEYFRALAAGVRAEAARQGVTLTLEAVDSFDAEEQATLLDACLENDSDALLVAPVAQEGLGAVFSRARARRVPVIDLLTGSGRQNVTARIATDRVAVGRAAGRFLAERHPPGGETARVVWLYGPPGSVVAEEVDRGFRAGIARGALEIVHAEAMQLDERTMRRAIRAVIDEVDAFDAVVGGSRMIQIAAEELAGAFTNGEVELVSLTSSVSTIANIEAQRVFAAVNDKVVAQGRIGVDLAIRAIEERPHLVDLRPRLEIVDRSNVDSFDRGTTLPPD